MTHWSWHRKNKQTRTVARNNIRYECHVVSTLSNRWSTLGLTVPEKQGNPGERKGETTALTAYSELAMAVHTETSMFAREALGNGKGFD